MTTAPCDALISARENRRMFDRIARRYDLLNALMSLGLHRYWRRRTVRKVLASGGHEFLDVGCGTGDVALALLREAPNVRVVGIDLSTEMLEFAMAKTRRAGMEPRATYQVGDATALPFADGVFDGATCAFCFRNIVDHAGALRELRRVLRPGSVLAILELTKPVSRLLGPVHHCYTRGVVPMMGRLLSQGSAYQYLADSIDHFPPSADVVALMGQAGFSESRHEPLSGGFVTLFSGRASGARGSDNSTTKEDDLCG